MQKSMKLPIVKHEDERRSLVEYISDFPIRTSKILTVKENSVLGNHYHKLKDDIFYLLKGSGTAVINNRATDFKKGDCLLVKKGTSHAFTLKKGSILIESSTTPYDKTDEYKS